MDGFKSYWDQQEIGPFHKRFTAIVGPNGSGKSNLIESLLFIFGKKASWMRLNQLRELIHSSQQHQDIPRASVEVCFQDIIDEVCHYYNQKDGENYTLIPGTEFSIRRTVNKKNVCKYEINNRDSSQAEVIELLKEKGIDLNNNRFLILQGEVEQISQMKPKTGDPDRPGLLEYLEDIIGSNAYNEGIESQEQLLDELQGQKREKADRMKVSEQSLASLNDAKQVAINFIKCEYAQFQIINALQQVAEWQAQSGLQEANQQTTTIQQQLDSIKDVFKEKLKANEDLVKEFQANKEAIDEMKNQQQNNEQRWQDLQERDAKLRSDLLFQSNNQTSLQDKQEKLRLQSNKLIGDVMELNNIIPKQEQNVAAGEKDLKLAKDLFENLNEQFQKQSSRLLTEESKLTQQLFPFASQDQELQLKRNGLQNKLQLITDKKQRLEEDKIQLSDKQDELKKGMDELSGIRQQLNQAQENLLSIKREKQSNLQQKRLQLQEIESEILAITQKIDAHRMSNSDNLARSQLLRALLKAQEDGHLSGIIGRIGDLATIDSLYDCAATSACAKANFILVKSYEDAQHCVEYLRKNQIGRASFLAMDKLEYWAHEMSRPFQAPPQSQRLFDLLKIAHEDYAPAIYSIVRDTLVAENIDIAVQLAFGGNQRRRVVCLNGQLIEQNGIMSGGGRAKTGGFAKNLQQVSHIDDEPQSLNVEKDNLEKRKVSLLPGVRQLEDELRELDKDGSQITSSIQKSQVDWEKMTTEARRVAQQLEKVFQELSNSKNGINDHRQIQDEMESIVQDILQIESSSAPIRQELDEIRQKIRAAETPAFCAAKEKYEKLNKEYTELKNELERNQINAAQMQKESKKVQLDQQNVAQNLEKAAQSIVKLNEQIQQLDQEALVLLTEIKATDEQLSALETEFDQKNQASRAIEALLKQMRDQLNAKRLELQQWKNLQIKKENDLKQAIDEKMANRQNCYDVRNQYDFLGDIQELEAIDMTQTSFMNIPQTGEPDQVKEEINEAEQSNIEDEQKGQFLQNMDNNYIGKEILAEIQEIDGNPQNGVSGITLHRELVRSLKQLLHVEVEEDFIEVELTYLSTKIEDLKNLLKEKQHVLKDLSSEANVNCINEFKSRYKEYRQKHEEFMEINGLIAQKKENLDNIKRKRYELFMSGFNTISLKLRETYQVVYPSNIQTLTNGGDAELELIDSLEPFNDGVNFTVRPPKKSWKQIGKLSGGEKTLSSLSLLFALHHYKPNPLYFMDEIDAALDYKNVSIVANYIKERTKDAQFIIISLRNNMFELANQLIGVYKTSDTTKTVPLPVKAIRETITRITACEH